MEDNEEVQKIENRRRSSIRRSILFQRTLSPIQKTSETSTESKTGEVGSTAVREVEEPIPEDLLEYINSVAKEHIAWKKEYNKRQAEEKSAKAKLKSLNENGEELDLSILNKEQREFLNAGIDHDKVLEQYEDLKKSAIKLAIATKLQENADKRLIELMQRYADIITKSGIKKIAIM